MQRSPTINTFRNSQFVSAVVFLLMAASFAFDNNGVQWMWKDTPVVGAILAGVSLVFWGFFARRAVRGHRSESRG